MTAGRARQSRALGAKGDWRRYGEHATVTDRGSSHVTGWEDGIGETKE